MTVTVFFLLAVIIAGQDCIEAPALDANDIPFVYDVNAVEQLHIIHYEELIADVNSVTLALPVCDDTNEVCAVVAASLPSFALIDPNDWISWMQYITGVQIAYFLTLKPTAGDEGVYYLTYQVAGTWHKTFADMKTYCIIINVLPNVGEPPVAQRPFAVARE